MRSRSFSATPSELREPLAQAPQQVEPEVPAVPQPSIEGSHHPGVASAIECIDSFAEPSRTNEQRLEAHIVDGRCPKETTPLRESFTESPLVLSEQHA